MEQSYAEFLEEQGEKKGFTRGREEGRAEGSQSLRTALRTLLTQRFGPITSEVEVALAEADLDQLNDWLLRAITASSLSEVGIGR